MKKFVYLFLFVGLILLFFSLEINFTGHVIATEIDVSNNILFVLSLTLFMISFILYISKKSLEALMIPTGVKGVNNDVNLERADAAMKRYQHSKDKPYILITGHTQRDKQGKIRKDSEVFSIYKYLREKSKTKPNHFISELESHDTLENFLYSIPKLKKKKIKNLQIATNPTQYWRFKMFEKQAKKEGLLDQDFDIQPIYTDESKKEFLYGVLAYAKDYLRLKSSGSLEKAKNQKTNNFGNYLKHLLEGAKKE